MRIRKRYRKARTCRLIPCIEPRLEIEGRLNLQTKSKIQWLYDDFSKKDYQESPKSRTMHRRSFVASSQRPLDKSSCSALAPAARGAGYILYAMQSLILCSRDCLPCAQIVAFYFNASIGPTERTR